jgi:hypothetical protein
LARRLAQNERLLRKIGLQGGCSAVLAHSCTKWRRKLEENIEKKNSFPMGLQRLIAENAEPTPNLNLT